MFRGSDFWGYCDIDLVFGDISALLNSGRFENADFFCADAGPVVGTFCIYRNSQRVNSFALNLPEYIKRLNSSEYESLDEKEMTKALAQAPDVRHLKVERLSESQLSISADGRMVGRTGGVVGDPNEFYWTDGHTFVKSPGHAPQEVLYLHFIGLKRSYHWARYDPARIYPEYGFSASGFQPWRTPPSWAAAIHLNARVVMLRSIS